jgi:hypothetical protein
MTLFILDLHGRPVTHWLAVKMEKALVVNSSRRIRSADSDLRLLLAWLTAVRGGRDWRILVRISGRLGIAYGQVLRSDLGPWLTRFIGLGSPTTPLTTHSSHLAHHPLNEAAIAHVATCVLCIKTHR